MMGKTVTNRMSRWFIALMVSALVLPSLLVFSACSSIECPIQNTVATVYALTDTLKDTLTVKTRRNNGKDSIILNLKVNPTKFNLPISDQRNADTLVFMTKRLAAVDTVWIEKDDMPHFESVDCGLSFFHQLKSVRSTHVGIDTIVIIKSFVDYDLSNAHFSITFKPRN
jgi:hypothetical protein